MKRLISILTLIATLGFVLPTPVEAAKAKDKDKKSHVSSKKKHTSVAQSGRSNRNNGRNYYSNRSGPVIVYPVTRRHRVGPRPSLFNFVIRL